MAITSPCYVAGGLAANVAREHLRRDVLGFIAYHTYMAIPTWLPFGWFTWMLPTVGDWSERDARWTFAMEETLSSQAPHDGVTDTASDSDVRETR